MTRRFLSTLACLAICFGVAEGNQTVELENLEGKTITVELLEKSETAVRVRFGRKTILIPFSTLSENSVKLVKFRSIPIMAEFSLDVDVSTRRKKTSSVRHTPGGRSSRATTEVNSVRKDKVSGKVTVKNRDVKEPSPKAELYVSFLSRGKAGIGLLRRDIFQVDSIKPLEEIEFETGESVTTHSAKGTYAFAPAREHTGRYYGYIAAIVIDGRIVEIKSVPDTFEQDLDAAKKYLHIGDDDDIDKLRFKR